LAIELLDMREALWGCCVKLSQICLAVVALCFAAVNVHADGIPGDGTIRLGRGSDPSPAMSCDKTDFKIKLNGHGGGITNCINTSGVDWIGLDIFAVIPGSQTVTCIPLLFASCTTQSLGGFGHSGKKEVEIELFGGAVITAGSATDVCTGADPAHSCFFINLNDSLNGSINPNPNAAGGWFGLSGSGTLDGPIRVVAVTPEPSTLLLFVGGAAAICFRRRRVFLA
jgi:hypothetical protein